MKIIPRNIHAILDYVVGLLLVASPWLFGFAHNGPATTVSLVLGAGAILYSLLTRYEAGLIKAIPFKVHLMLDVASGVLLMISPWLFGFANTVYLPHVIVGLFEIMAGLMTKNTATSSTAAPGFRNA